MSTPYDVITDRIIAQLEEGTVPWLKPWHGKAGSSMPLFVCSLSHLPRVMKGS